MLRTRRLAFISTAKSPAIRHVADGCENDEDTSRRASSSWVPPWQPGPGFSGRLGEIVVKGHAPADVSVEVPLYRSRGKGALRVSDFFETGILGRFLRLDLVEHLELFLQHRIRRPVEPDLVFSLELDVVLRVAVDRLPRHVL